MEATEHTIVCAAACRVEHTKLALPSPILPVRPLSSPCPLCRRFDAWIPVCHSTCNTAYWLVLDDPSRRKTPAHRSSTLNAPDAVANFDEVCGCGTCYTRGEGKGKGGGGESITPSRFARYRKWNASIILGRMRGRRRRGAPLTAFVSSGRRAFNDPNRH